MESGSNAIYGQLGSRQDQISLQRCAGILQALTSAPVIRTHLDFYHWLQGDLRPFLPHKTMIAAWGNFDTGEICLDVTSMVPGVNTERVLTVKGLGKSLSHLYKHTRKPNQGWSIVRLGQAITAKGGIDIDSPYYIAATAGIAELLIYTTRDERVSHDRMYIFLLDHAERTHLDYTLLDIFMPHMDSALRKIKCVGKVAADRVAPRGTAIENLSHRELEILHWVSQGKSNEEIGVILEISYNTVKNHLKRIFGKLHVSARSQAVREYLQRDYVHYQ